MTQSSSKNGTPWLNEPTRVLQGSQYVKGMGQNLKGNSMITPSVSRVNPWRVQVLSIKPAQSGSDALASADVSVSLSIPISDNATFSDNYNLYGIEVRRGKHKTLSVGAQWVSRASGYGPYFAPQPGGFLEAAITKAILTAYRAKIEGLGVR